MAFQKYLSIKGTQQGQFKGESKNPRRNAKWIEILEFSYPVQAPHDAGSGQASGKRQHSPITITKEWGAASPQFLSACTTNEVLTEVVIQVADNSKPGGQETVAETITLTNAMIVARRPHVGAAAHGGRNLTEFDITFQKIEMSALASKSAAKDSWEG
jgi:type VI secretion system secreted protein Hcp